MTKTVEIKWLIEVLDWIGQNLYDIASIDPVVANPYETPTETLNTIAIGPTVYSVGGGGGRTVDFLAGDLSATYTSSLPSYNLPTTDTALPSGKHWLDYDEIIIVSITQMNATALNPRWYLTATIPTYLLQTGNNEGNYGVTVVTPTASANIGTRVILYPNDTYKTDWYNYASPIAILGVKY